MENFKTKIFEILVSIFILVGAVIFLEESVDIPPGRYEPLGSGFFPFAICIVLIVLLFADICIILLKNRVTVRSSDVKNEQIKRYDMAAGIYCLTILYVCGLELWINFGVITSVFLIFSMVFLGMRRFRQILISIPMALCIGLSIEYVFKYLFVIDLP